MAACMAATGGEKSTCRTISPLGKSVVLTSAPVRAGSQRSRFGRLEAASRSNAR
jgi:hypothetical protein